MPSPACYGPYVPSELMAKYIAMWLSKDPERTLEACAWTCGLPARSLFRIIHRECETVRFVTADKILLGLGYHLAWYEDEQLSEFYAAA